jgi:hypothetical protein
MFTERTLILNQQMLVEFRQTLHSEVSVVCKYMTNADVVAFRTILATGKRFLLGKPFFAEMGTMCSFLMTR